MNLQTATDRAGAHDVIVCIHNGHDDVTLCLDSLVRTWNDSVLGRLILVNDASDDLMKSCLDGMARRHAFVEVIHLSSQHYYTRAANIGLRESSAQVRTLLNSDTLVTPGWAAGIRQVLALHPTVGIAGPLSNAASTQSVPFVKSSRDQTAINSLPEGVSVDAFADYIRQSASGRPIPFVPLVHGFCLTLTADVIDEIGLFDEAQFPRGYGEENDYCFRAEDAGFILAIALGTFVFHAKSKSYRASDRAQLMHDGMGNLVERHGIERIKNAVRFMEENPHLQYMRDSVLNRWPEHYRIEKNLEQKTQT